MNETPLNLAALRERYEMAAESADRAGEAFERRLWLWAAALTDVAEAAREAVPEWYSLMQAAKEDVYGVLHGEAELVALRDALDRLDEPNVLHGGYDLAVPDAGD
jgi:hypothetical protein